MCTDLCLCTAYSDTILGNITCLRDECVNTELDQNSSLETNHVRVRSAEMPLIRRLAALFLSTGMHAFLHSNTLIYSLLKLNTAANTPSDSITLCPHRSANEGCTPLIKFQSAIKMFKICLIECWRWRLPSHGYIPDLFEDTQVLKFQIRALHISHASVIQTR